jgi:peptidoglycan-associated lipoprotein
MIRLAGSVVLVAVGAAMLLACGHEQTAPPPATPASSPPVSVTRTTSNVVPAAAPPQSNLNVSSAILQACKIDFDNVDTAPKFDFDNSALKDDERSILSKVAECVTTGPLKGQSLDLIGRADPRGEVEYNFALGASRAGSVRDYLTQLGVDGSRITTTSRGKLDATGTDEAGWQRDRRVDVDLK